MKYLIKLTPLEPYAFGTEQGFEYPDESGLGKNSYFVTSGLMPEQTTIWGMLRFWLLSNEGLLHSDFCYTPEEQKKIDLLIGTESFNFQAKETQCFGKLVSISPLFLLNNKNEILIKNPFCNKSQDKYSPIKMSDSQVATSEGVIRLPEKDEYNAKYGYAEGFINLKTMKVENDLFEVHLISGNRKNNKNDSDEDCYFKREVVTFKNDKKDYAFAAYLEVADDLAIPESEIVYMGHKQSAFRLEAFKAEHDEELSVQVEKAFDGVSTEPWQCALSDLYVSEGSFDLDTFSIIEEKYLRNLETKYSESGQLKKIRKSNVRYSLVRSGSVFFEHCPLNLENEQVKRLGYNQVVQLGGHK